MAGCLSCGVAVYRWGARSLCPFLALRDAGAWITGAAVNARFDAIKCTLLFAKSDWNGGYLILREAVSCAFTWGKSL